MNDKRNWVHYSSLVTHMLYKCPTCAALIVEDDIEQHNQWHLRINHAMGDHRHNSSGDAVVRQ